MLFRLFIIISLFSAFPASAEEQSNYVLAQHSFYVENGDHLATNYSAGTCYPANSKFKLLSVERRLFGNGDIINITDQDGNLIKIKNVDKYTKINIDKLEERMLGSNAINLDQLSSEVQSAINECKVIIGMTREEVLLARGYPPAHQTPDLDSDEWRYWHKRLSQGVVHFKNGKVTRVEGSI